MKKGTRRKTTIQYSFVILFISIFIMEFLFKLFSHQELFHLSLLRIFLFTFVFSLASSLLLQFLPFKIQRFLILLILFFISTYMITQLGFKSFMGNYISMAAVGDGATRITEYIIPFIRHISLINYLLYLPFLFWLALFIFHKVQWQKEILVFPILLVLLLSTLCLHGISLLTLHTFTKDTDLVNIADLYAHASFQELALQEFGAVRFLSRDIALLFQEEQPVIVAPIPTPSSTPTLPAIDDFSRNINDLIWNELSNNESNKNIKTIDAYLQSKPISDFNEMSDYFKNKNLILIMVEAFDYMAVDKKLTPTLYKMMNEGIHFENHFTPKYSCTTGESEFISQVSLVPSTNVCTPNEYMNNDFSQSIFALFNQKGYYSSSYHNWNDQFYNRHTLHKNMGSTQFLDVEDLQIKLIQGWQSDKTLIELAIPYFIDKQPFFTYLITSSMHFPYNEPSTLGDRYLNQVQAVYPDYPLEIQRYLSKTIELDHGLAYLIEQLEIKGIASDTVIAMFADHHPLNVQTSLIVEATQQLNRNFGFNIDQSPFYIYQPHGETLKVAKTNSTFDILPTLANLFGLNYDPRYYVGTDIFSDQESLVIFTNGNWVNDHGFYQASRSKFTAFDSSFSYTNEEIAAINTKVNNQFSISNLIYKTNYFKTRNFKVQLLP